MLSSTSYELCVGVRCPSQHLNLPSHFTDMATDIHSTSQGLINSVI